MTYVYLGGIRASIYTEVLQFFLIVVGTFSRPVMALHSSGGISALLSRLPDKTAHTWRPILHPEGASYLGGLFSVTICLGIASFAYWSTDLLVIQRAFAAKDFGCCSENAHRRIISKDVAAHLQRNGFQDHVDLCRGFLAQRAQCAHLWFTPQSGRAQRANNQMY